MKVFYSIENFDVEFSLDLNVLRSPEPQKVIFKNRSGCVCVFVFVYMHKKPETGPEVYIIKTTVKDFFFF